MSSPETSNKLINRLLECVQKCQKRYGGKTELATELDSCVSSLCFTLEAVFRHGLRNKPPKPIENISAVKQVSDIVEIVANTLSFNNDNQSFWPFIKRHLTIHECDRYDNLKQIWTDTGRGKAWIRSTLNERSLERYLLAILSNKEILSAYYESWALLCDDENNSLLPNMAAGLAAILFAISIDKPEFNSCILNKNEKVLVEPIIEAPIKDKSVIKETKKRRKVATIISFDEDETTGVETPNIPINTKSVIDRLTKKDCDMKKVPSTTMEDEVSSSDTQSSNSTTSLGAISKPSSSELTIESSGSRDKFSTKVEGSTLTPLDSENIGELTPIADVEDDNGDDNNACEEAIEVPTDVSAILTVVEAKNREEVNRLQDKIKLLCRENESLKERLKSYMEAVQLLKQPDGTVPDYKSEAKLFEQKLVQVAEMHAELMDFNVILQQALLQKENQVEKLKNELEIFRGPFQDDDVDRQSCVNVWIPSAFLTGTGSEAHHVYQIYLRAGSDEWNIYRRYAQFHALHSDLKKLDSAIGAFNFPPKKGLGNKEASVVEDRRKRLQTYLRQILTHWPELSQCNSRFLLEQHLAFFKEQKDTKKNGLFTKRSTPPNENHYTGL